MNIVKTLLALSSILTPIQPIAGTCHASCIVMREGGPPMLLQSDSEQAW